MRDTLWETNERLRSMMIYLEAEKKNFVATAHTFNDQFNPLVLTNTLWTVISPNFTYILLLLTIGLKIEILKNEAF